MVWLEIKSGGAERGLFIDIEAKRRILPHARYPSLLKR